MKLIKSLRAVSSRSLGLLALFVAVSASRCIASPITVIPPRIGRRQPIQTDIGHRRRVPRYLYQHRHLQQRVNTEANSVAALAALGTTWLDIGSTFSTNAIDNVGQDPECLSIIWKDSCWRTTGPKMLAAFFQATYPTPSNNFYYNSGGLVGPSISVWTGSHDNGEASQGPLGSLNEVTLGVVDTVHGFGWLESGSCAAALAPNGCGAENLGHPNGPHSESTSLRTGFPVPGTRQLLAPRHSPVRPHWPPSPNRQWSGQKQNCLYRCGRW